MNRNVALLLAVFLAGVLVDYLIGYVYTTMPPDPKTFGAVTILLLVFIIVLWKRGSKS